MKAVRIKEPGLRSGPRAAPGRTGSNREKPRIINHFVAKKFASPARMDLGLATANTNGLMQFDGTNKVEIFTPRNSVSPPDAGPSSLFPFLPRALRYYSPGYAIYAAQEGHLADRFDSQRARFVLVGGRVVAPGGPTARRAGVSPHY
jgi:hypothetical protein